MKDEIAAQVITGIFTLAAGTIAWWFTLASDWIARRRARREALGAILTALLEVRHRMVHLRAFGDLVSRFPSEHRATWLRVIESVEDLLPDLSPLSASYDDALALLSQENPVLAYRLRYKDRFFGKISDMRVLFQQLGGDEPPDELLHTLNRYSAELTTDTVDETIKAVAWQHGWNTRLRIRSCLRSTTEHKAEMATAFSRYVDDLVRSFPDDEDEIRKAFASVLAPNLPVETK